MNSGNSLTRFEAVNLRLAGLGVREADLTEQFVHSGGKGGQNVNKVSTAVRLKYGNEDVKCMEERSQLLNRVRAREILAEKLEKKREDKKLSERAAAEKARKLKAGRPKSAKRRILQDKRIKSKVKQNRKYIPGRDE
ncbi:MAG: peptide chain release factor-like protein [Candidatus Goldiibacteriota bacterium]|jgi:protein subunit release factor B